MVEVGGRENDLAAGERVGMTVRGSAPFAASLGALEAGALGDLGLIVVVKVLLGGVDGHQVNSYSIILLNNSHHH